jgi:Bifunctional DNA primase/polymerase, N-terminal
VSATNPPSPCLEAARAYRTLGWWCVPIPTKQKRPVITGWPALRLEVAELAQHLAGEGNVGVLLGVVSGGLTDIDLDSHEAVELAPRVLPPTWTFGRPSKPRSHWLFLVEGGCAYRKFLDRPDAKGERDTLLELRSGKAGDKALQTVFPPSVHPSGEPVAWSHDCGGTDAPRVLAETELVALVEELHAAVVLRRHVPEHLEPWLAGGDWPGVGDELTRLAWGAPETTPPPAPARLRPPGWGDLDQAVAAYNSEHTRALPRAGTGRCPICGHSGCFGALPEREGRWACFSAAHPDGAGVVGSLCVTGDALDLDAWAARLSRVELLRRERYLGGRS